MPSSSFPTSQQKGIIIIPTLTKSFTTLDTTVLLFLNGSDNLYLDCVATFATRAWMWIPLYVSILYVFVREHSFRQLAFLLAGLAVGLFLCDQVSSTLVKPLVARWRPTHEPALSHLIDIVGGYRGGNYGFFSSHAANTCFIATYASLILRRREVALSLFAWCLLNCWTRLYLGAHYPSDILVGVAFGTFVGCLAYLLVIRTRIRTHYSATRCSVITTSFLLTLVFITIPWRVYF